MNVKHICFYLTDWNGISPRQEDYTAAKIVHCLKGREVKGYFDVILRGVRHHVDDKNKHEFLTALWAAIGDLYARALSSTHALVPIPNSGAIVGSASVYRTLSFAQQIAQASSGKLIATDALRWKRAEGEVHKAAGLRTPDPRYENLAVIAKTSQPIILFDDVITSGSSFVAACWCLADLSMAPVAGLVVARRTIVQEPTMFSIEDRDLPIPPKPFYL